jgi:hypothetical protein
MEVRFPAGYAIYLFSTVLGLGRLWAHCAAVQWVLLPVALRKIFGLQLSKIDRVPWS